MFSRNQHGVSVAGRRGININFVPPQTRANSVAWNPMEAFNFTAASEDCNLYSYDMRNLSSATCVHQVPSPFF